jgi:hypothetical protein
VCGLCSVSDTRLAAVELVCSCCAYPPCCVCFIALGVLLLCVSYCPVLTHHGVCCILRVCAQAAMDAAGLDIVDFVDVGIEVSAA